MDYDASRRCKGIRTTSNSCPYTFDQTNCSFTVTLSASLLNVEATTGHGKTLSKSFGSGISKWTIIGIRNDSLDVN